MNLRSISSALVLAAITVLPGCAHLVSGDDQSLMLSTVDAGIPFNGARCALMNDKGSWYVTTPGAVTVHRSFHDLSVQCVADGLPIGLGRAKSETRAMVMANFLPLGAGLIGVGIDMETGAAYDYPPVIQIGMGTLVVLPPRPASAPK